MTSIKCKECGKMENYKSSAIPNSGCLVDNSSSSTDRQTVPFPSLSKKTESKVWLWVVSIIVLVGIGCTNSSQAGRSIKSKLQAVTTVEEARELIDGTVWHYTKNLSDPDDQIGFWMKVEFHGDTYTHYRADPNDGEWEKVNEGTYEVVEKRYSDTGEKYIAVEWDGSELLLPLKLSLSLETFRFAATTRGGGMNGTVIDLLKNPYRTPNPSLTRYGVMEFGDYDWD